MLAACCEQITHPSADFWASVELTQRSVLTGWLLLVPANLSFVRLIFAMLTAHGMFALTMAARPYRQPEDNKLASAAALLAIGESAAGGTFDAARHTALTILANTILNLDETMTRE